MTRYSPTLAALLLLAVLAPAVLAEEQPIELKPDPGQEETQNSSAPVIASTTSG